MFNWKQDFQMKEMMNNQKIDHITIIQTPRNTSNLIVNWIVSILH